MKQFVLFIILAFILFFLMFSPWTAPHVNFWLLMSFSAGLLSYGAFIHQHDAFKKLLRFQAPDILVGFLSAAGLYLIFFVGHWAVTQLFPFGEREIESIYIRKIGTSPVLIGFLLLFLIGPAEEIFWRGYVQQRLSQTHGNKKGYIMASLIYTLVHIWSFNFTLLIASLICGLFWGFLYMRYQRLWPVIISHALWDVTIFVLFPVY